MGATRSVRNTWRDSACSRFSRRSARISTPPADAFVLGRAAQPHPERLLHLEFCAQSMRFEMFWPFADGACCVPLATGTTLKLVVSDGAPAEASFYPSRKWPKRTRSRTPASIGSNQSSKRYTAVSTTGCEESDFVIILFMAWSPVRRSNVG